MKPQVFFKKEIPKREEDHERKHIQQGGSNPSVYFVSLTVLYRIQKHKF